MAESQKPQAVYEPGELARTREKLGLLDAEEAKLMAKKLGGVVGVEKSASPDADGIKKSKRPLDRSGPTETAKAPPQHRRSSYVSGAAVRVPPGRARKRHETLPEIPPKERARMELVMMSGEYQIKQGYGAFNFLYFLMKNRPNTILVSYVEKTIARHIGHIRQLVETVLAILELAPESHKQKVASSDELRYRLMKKFMGWQKSLEEVQKLYNEIDAEPGHQTIEPLVPLVRAFYKMFAQVLYLGEGRVTAMFRAEFDELSSFPDAKKSELLQYMKTATTEWQYVYNKAILGMYPLLMRMVSTECFEPADDFFTAEAARILPFLGITKYDVLVADKKQSADHLVQEVKAQKAKYEEEDKADKEERAKAEAEERNERLRLTETGLKLLEVMFPDAGWFGLSLSTDMFPYFQPIYQFPDGVNLLAPQNPIQMIIVLIRILEDFLRGCRNIKFDLPPEFAQTKNDTFASALTEWMSYREVLFEKSYAPDLKDYVNNLYSKPEFAHSPIGKKLIYSLLWQTKQYFLPFFKIDALPLEKPVRDISIRLLSARVAYLRDVFAWLAEKIDEASATRAEIPEIPNAWEKYKFDIDNAVSARLDVLLGAKKNSPMAVNASIVKYTATVIAVLDWWINDESSPARNRSEFELFRTSPVDGKPVFSVELREGTEELFKQNLRKLAQGGQTAGAAKEASPGEQAAVSAEPEKQSEQTPA
jgi:hypothetical protein